MRLGFSVLCFAALAIMFSGSRRATDRSVRAMVEAVRKIISTAVSRAPHLWLWLILCMESRLRCVCNDLECVPVEKREGQLARIFSDFTLLLLSSCVSKNFHIPTITVGDISLDAYVKYQDSMYGVILSCELTEGEEEYLLLSCMGQL